MKKYPHHSILKISNSIRRRMKLSLELLMHEGGDERGEGGKGEVLG